MHYTDLLYYFNNNPILVLSLIAGLVLLCRNYKKLVIKTGKAVGIFLAFLVNALSAAGMVVAVVVSAIGSGYSVRTLYLASFLTELINLHIIPWLYFSISKYEIYIIPKIIFLLNKPFFQSERMAPEEFSYITIESDMQECVFRMPAPVLLQ